MVPPDQTTQDSLRQTQLLLQRRQKGSIVIGLTLRAEHVHLRYRTGLARGPDQRQAMLIIGHDPLYDPDLRAQRSNLQCLDHDVATDTERDSVKPRRLKLRVSGRQFDTRSRCSEYVEVVTDYRASRVR